MNKDVATELGIMPGQVVRWRGRFATGGLAAIKKDAPRRGRKPRKRDAGAGRIIEMTTQQRPAQRPALERAHTGGGVGRGQVDGVAAFGKPTASSRTCHGRSRSATIRVSSRS